jgi:hypothetical protein
MTIQIKDSGRVSDDVLGQLEKIDLNEAGKQVSGMKPLLEKTRFGKRLYDPATHIIWLSSQGHVENIGDVQSVGGTLLMQTGTLISNCYVLAENAAKEIPLCQKAISSIRVSPDRVYQSR